MNGSQRVLFQEQFGEAPIHFSSWTLEWTFWWM